MYVESMFIVVSHRNEDIEEYGEAEHFIRRALSVEPESIEAREALRFIFFKKVLMSHLSIKLPNAI